MTKESLLLLDENYLSKILTQCWTLVLFCCHGSSKRCYLLLLHDFPFFARWWECNSPRRYNCWLNACLWFVDQLDLFFFSFKVALLQCNLPCASSWNHPLLWMQSLPEHTEGNESVCKTSMVTYALMLLKCVLLGIAWLQSEVCKGMWNMRMWFEEAIAQHILLTLACNTTAVFRYCGW